MKKTIITPDQELEIAEKYKSGIPTNVLTNQYRTNFFYLKAILNKNGVEIKPRCLARNIIGHKYGRWTVLSQDGKKWLCKCDCGATRKQSYASLSKKLSISCGCSRNQFFHQGFIDKGVMNSILSSAKQRGIEFNISPEFLKELIIKQSYRCALSKEPIVLNKRRDSTASLDRIDSTLGYVEGNVQWVHRTVNLMKLNYDSVNRTRWNSIIYNPALTSVRNENSNELFINTLTQNGFGGNQKYPNLIFVIL